MTPFRHKGVLSVNLFHSPLASKKYRAVFYDNGEKIRHTDFGAKSYEDYTTHGDKQRREDYLRRHKPNEDWDDPYSAGALSRWVLWNKPTLVASWNDYKRRFHFQ